MILTTMVLATAALTIVGMLAAVRGKYATSAMFLVFGVVINTIASYGMAIAYLTLPTSLRFYPLIEEAIKIVPFLAIRNKVHAFAVSLSFGLVELSFRDFDSKGGQFAIATYAGPFLLHSLTSLVNFVAAQQRRGIVLGVSFVLCTAIHYVFNEFRAGFSGMSDSQLAWYMSVEGLILIGVILVVITKFRPGLMKTV